VLRADDRLVVACGANAVEIVELQQPGRQRLPASDFLNGYSLSDGEQLGDDEG
jgi:methionyl-tRNA formyltransferase